MNVLIVDDHAVVRKGLMQLLREEFLTIDFSEASYSTEVNAIIKTKIWDIILMDIQLPEMDGYETTHYIRNETAPPKCNLPIVAMTAHAFASELEKCHNAKMNDYISKPFDENKLYEKMLDVLDLKK